MKNCIVFSESLKAASMAFNEDSSTNLAGEMVSTVNIVSVEYDLLNLNDENSMGKDAEYVTLLSVIPFEHYMILFSVVVFLSITLNLLVLTFYRKSSDMTRVYVIALVLVDWTTILCFIPTIFLSYANLDNDVKQSLFLFCLIALNSGFGMYLYPSLFLALDRTLVVLFPLTFRDYVSKLRIVKIIWASIPYGLYLSCLCWQQSE